MPPQRHSLRQGSSSSYCGVLLSKCSFNTAASAACCSLPQESGSISEWERLLAASLPPDGGYERIAWQSLRAIHLVLFASKHFRRQVLSIRGSAVATGIGNLVGNKVRATRQRCSCTQHLTLFQLQHLLAALAPAATVQLAVNVCAQ